MKCYTKIQNKLVYDKKKVGISDKWMSNEIDALYCDLCSVSMLLSSKFVHGRALACTIFGRCHEVDRRSALIWIHMLWLAQNETWPATCCPSRLLACVSDDVFFLSLLCRNARSFFFSPQSCHKVGMPFSFYFEPMKQKRKKCIEKNFTRLKAHFDILNI